MAEVEVPDELRDVSNKEILSGYRVANGQVVAKDSTPTRAAMITVYGVPCGISTYAEMLQARLSDHFHEFHIFAEHEDGYGDGPGLTRCWTRGEPLTDLITAIENYDPDVIFIQHEYGLFPKASHWLSLMGALARWRVVVTLHSVYEHHRDKTIVEAACPEIIVHTSGGQEALRAKGVAAPIHLIPHGCLPLDEGKLWNLYGTPHTIVQSGFGFPYKGYDNALRVVAKLKETYPDVFYTALVSERWPGSAKEYVADLNRLAAELGVTENVGIIRGFQSDECLDAYLRTNQVALFPYRDNGEHTVLGASGAIRLAMSKGIACVASGVPLFEGVEGVVPRPTTVDGWVEAIASLFEDPSEQLARQAAYLQANSWQATAARYAAVVADN